MMSKKVQRSIVFNPEYEMDIEPHKYVKTMSDFALTKELIVDFFRNNDNASLRLRLMQLERRLTMTGVCIHSERKIKNEIKRLRDEIGIESKNQARIRELKEKLASREWSYNSRWRIDKEIERLESKE